MTDNPICSIVTTIATSPKDWGLEKRDAWIYGIVMGWDDASLVELQRRFRWDDATVRRLVRLNKKFETLAVMEAHNDR